MTDLDQKVEEARRVFVEKIARMALTTGPVQPNGSGDAYAALEQAIAERATTHLTTENANLREALGSVRARLEETLRQRQEKVLPECAGFTVGESAIAAIIDSALASPPETDR